MSFADRDVGKERVQDLKITIQFKLAYLGLLQTFLLMLPVPQAP
ncbi:MAG: hypothetical protein ACI9JR_001491, partial [Gammaproteobacteria bacterium]